jgi:hypothetical protein
LPGQPRRTCDRVELVASFGEAGCGVHVVIRAERDDRMSASWAPVSVVTPLFRVDRRDRLLHEAHAPLDDVPVRKANGVERRPPEQDVELRVAEDERVLLVDQRDVDAVADRL